LYFRRLISELNLTSATVKIVSDGGSAPRNVVNDTERYLKDDDDFEYVFCVFDRDRHATYDEALNKLKDMSKKKIIKGEICAIPSVPCFEIWYLWHKSNSAAPFEDHVSPATKLIEELKKIDCFKKYTKTNCSDIFDEIRPGRQNAIDVSRRVLADAKLRGEVEYHENPSTRVHLVVDVLQKISEQSA
jgi:hypothetical protein